MSKQALRVIAGAPDRPLTIAGIEIQCYVLEDETRVFSQRAMLRVIGAGRGGAHTDRGAEIPRILASKSIFPFVSNELIAVLKSPIEFQPPEGGRTAYGYPAILLADVCETILAARDAGALSPRQFHIANQCEALIRGFARVGIIALVDEATGYQEIRAKRALAAILEKFIAKDLQSWTKTFNLEFYLEIARLRGWPSSYAIKRPSVVAKYTNNFVYGRIAPGLLKELRRKNPTISPGRRRAAHHQWFTPEHGHPKLKEHLAAVTALLRAAPNWTNFERSINRAFPIQNTDIDLPLDYNE